MNQVYTSDRSIILTNKLNFFFGRRQVLHDIDLSVPRGSIYGFLGPNGAGKTTTIKCLLGLYQVGAGMINVFNQDLHSHRLSILARTGNMVEEPSLYGHLSATNNLKILTTLKQCSQSRIAAVLDIVGLTQDAHRPVRQFSSGMKQRLSIAMALLAEPELLIMDEPINGMDPGGIIEIRTLLKKLSDERGVTIFISSHILSEIEKLCTHVAIINKGRLMFQDTIDNLPDKEGSSLEVLVDMAVADEALRILNEKYPARWINNSIRIKIHDRNEIPGIIETLVHANIAVYQVKSELTDLETAFLDLIQEADR